MTDSLIFERELRRGFWHYLLERHPAGALHGYKVSSKWDCRVQMPGPTPVVLSINAASYCSAFLRPPDGVEWGTLTAWLLPHKVLLEKAFGAAFEPPSGQEGICKTRLELSVYSADNWPDIADFFEERRHLAKAILSSLEAEQ